VAQQLGFTPEQIQYGLLTPEIGNTYSGAVPLGLAHVLDHAKPGDRIFVTSYGSGAGSDAFDITVTDEIANYKRDNAPVLDQILSKVVYLDYGTYAKYKGKIVMPE
jgi:hydroxymethylglutaryl-CoA synthase